MAQIARSLDYGVICADCRDVAALKRMLGGRKVNLVVTSPPYAAQREYDNASGFKPIKPDKYLDWYKDVSAAIQEILADDGSYFLNIKEHADEGERSLYVKDLVLAHKRNWGWRFVDEFCWRKTDNGVPGGWGNRFKNSWEPVFHFCLSPAIKFRPDAVSHHSDNCFVYSPNNSKSASGSGLLGTGPRGAAADGGKNQKAWARTRSSADNLAGYTTGLARPSNVIEVRTECTQGSHSAPFPVGLPEFFIKAFTDPGDVIFDPFLGSGTTMIAALKHGRHCYGCELSPAYCDVIVTRVQDFGGRRFALDGDGRTFEELKKERVAEAA